MGEWTLDNANRNRSIVFQNEEQVDHLPLGLEVRVSRCFDHSLYLDGW